MRRWICGLLIVLWATPVAGQAVTRLASQSTAGNLATDGDVLPLTVPGGVGFGSVGVEIAGTWTGTIEVQCAASLGGSTFVALTLAPRNSTVLVTSMTANGQWVGSIAGCQRVRATATAAMTGSAQVTLVGNFTASLPVLFSGSITPVSIGLPASTCAAPALYEQGATTTGIAFTATPSILNCVSATARTTLTASSLTVTVPTLEADGTAGAPSYSYTNGATSGLFFAAGPARIGMSIGTAELMRWAAAGILIDDATPIGWSDVSLSRGAANRLDLASGDSFSLVGGGGSFRINNSVFISSTAATVPVACTTPTVTWSNGTAAFQIDVGTSCTGVTTLAITLPAATNGWACDGINTTTNTVYVTQTGAGTTTSATFTNYGRTTGLAVDFVDGADIRIKCIGG